VSEILWTGATGSKLGGKRRPLGAKGSGVLFWLGGGVGECIGEQEGRRRSSFEKQKNYAGIVWGEVHLLAGGTRIPPKMLVESEAGEFVKSGDSGWAWGCLEHGERGGRVEVFKNGKTTFKASSPATPRGRKETQKPGEKTNEVKRKRASGIKIEGGAGRALRDPVANKNGGGKRG